MPSSEKESVTDSKVLERLAVVEASHRILVGDFQKSREHIDETLGAIFENITACKKALEEEIRDVYMTKTAGELQEQRLASDTRSIKLWIVSTASGCTSAGVFILWLLNVGPNP